MIRHLSGNLPNMEEKNASLLVLPQKKRAFIWRQFMDSSKINVQAHINRLQDVN